MSDKPIKIGYSSEEIDEILKQLKKAEDKGLIEQRFENNNYLLISYKGIEENGISPKWNIKIYKLNKRGIHRVVCVDDYVLAQILNSNYDYFTPPDLKLLMIDDAGWGFPLGGVMVGVTDNQTIKTDIVPISYFQGVIFEQRDYLYHYAQLGLNLVHEYHATPKTHRIEICSGYINSHLREQLREMNYHIRVVEIKGLLQDKLEEYFKKYIKELTGSNIYYDPKELKKEDIPFKYNEALEYGIKHCPEIIKTGWKAISL